MSESSTHDRDAFDEGLAEREAVTIDPHPTWASRRLDPVVVTDDGMGGRMCELFRRAEIEPVLRDGERFSTSITQETMGPYMGTLMLGMDGDEHARYRALVSHAFRSSKLEGWEQTLVRPTFETLVDRIEADRSAELVGQVTGPYATSVISTLMGVPADEHRQLHAWSEAINAGPLHPAEGREASAAMRAYLEPIVADRRARPRDDLISDLVQAEVDGERLDDDHLYGFLRLLLPAGAETTYRELGILLAAVLGNDGWWDRIVADPSTIPAVVEETLRWDSSAPLAIRVATTDVEIGGCPVPAGARVMMTMGSANRDADVYADADRWNPERPLDQPHLAFGWGRHLCLGMHLARMELRVALEVLAERMPGLRLDPDQPPPVVRGVAFRGPDALHVRW